MKNRILALLAFAALICAFTVTAAHAADAVPAAPAAAGSFSWAALLTDGQFWIGLLAVGAAIVAFWKHTQATGLRKALGAAVVGVEQFSLTPEGAAVGDKLKSLIQAKAAEYPKSAAILSDTVAALTPAVKAQLDALTAVPPVTVPVTTSPAAPAAS